MNITSVTVAVGATETVHIVKQDGLPVDQSKVTVVPSPGPVTALSPSVATVTAVAGGFLVSGLAEGSGVVRFTYAGGAWVDFTVEVPSPVTSIAVVDGPAV